MSMRLVRLDDVAATPWRNGGGVTRELLAWPDGADWTLRLSVADITQDGAFSAFPGVERWFAVLSGAGVRLGEPPLALRPGGAVHRFDGGLAPHCALIAGPTRDLNLMLRRGRASGLLAALAAGETLRCAATLRGVFAPHGGTLLRDGETPVTLAPMTLAWQDDAPPVTAWRMSAAAFAFECSLNDTGPR